MKGWDRRLWGVESDGAGPLGMGWHYREIRFYDGEPGRALLFTTRAAARRWCAQKHASYANRPVGDICRAWRFRAVRVRERITVTR